MIQTIRFTLNHKPVRLRVDGERMLLWVLRTDFGLTGAKYGCGEGFCGACTVLVNDVAVRACQTPVKAVAGKSVLTIEGLAQNGKLHPLQEAFIKHDALQCGFCTPGMILAAYSLLQQSPLPDPAEIAVGLEDHLCRCGAHQRIILAVQDAAQQMKGGNDK
ncbi:MAG: (2Fe-2S)-binding protein [candidate division KSB1 bacterium]|nr:(2Fe-2S)-binding protein [candidate division KSB1 bacterium]MDZ7319070.1 (2Fe-2S)-binding protein [candidate division KSB1 bacterium]MDZ7340533.1 (2Fe-2S)-binding protein [candidate division KSB1 bacterium]